MILYVLIGVLLIVLVVGVVFVVMTRSKDGLSGGGKRAKGRDSVLKNANKRLAQNPRDPEALFAIADIYFQEESWDKAMKTYETLSDLVANGPVSGVDSFEVYLRYALAAQKLNLIDQAYRGFGMARNIRQDNFEVNYNLGHLEFQRKNYEKAIQLLQQARIQDPDSSAVLRDLGHAFFRIKKPKEAMNFIRKAIDIAPEDKES